MKIQYLGHACFRLISEMGTSVICDPYNSDMVGFEMPHLSCDVVTVSHHHADHDCVDAVLGQPAVLDGCDGVAADDIAIKSIFSMHDPDQGSKRGHNYVFTFLIDGLRVAHLGDIGELNEELACELADYDVIMIPIGGIFTVDAVGAKWYVDRICPKIVIPMHYKTPEHSFEIGTVEPFLALFDKAQIHTLDGETLTLDDVPQEGAPQIYVLKRYCD